MTAPANVINFYAQAHWGSRYGVTDQFHPTPHKGLDCALFHGNVDVPALHYGTVAAAAASSSVGHYVTVLRADGLFDTYCHIVIGVKVGQAVKQGDRLGRQAMTQAEGGAAWQGQHTHLCLSRTRDGWAVWGYVNLDPTPGVIAVLTNAASSDGKPLDNSTQEEDMTSSTRVFQMIDANGADISDWSRIGPDVLPIGTFTGGYEATADHATAVMWIAQYGQDATGPIKRARTDYIAQQQFGANEYTLHRAWLAGLVGGGGGGGDFTAADRAVLNAIPNATAVGQALTSQASLIIAKIPTKATLVP